MKTIVLTRFLIDGLLGQPPLSDAAAHRAVRLLRATLQPSLANQACRKFEWWVVGGERLRDVEIPEARKLVIPSGGDFHSTVLAALAGTEGPLLTIRLDSDDAVDRDFVGAFANAAWDVMDLGTGEEWHGPAVVLHQPRGFVCDVTACHLVRRKYPHVSPFSALLEKDAYRTIFAARHRHLGKEYGVVQFPGTQTVQFLHGGNAATTRARFVTRLEDFWGFDWPRFGVDIEALRRVAQ